jgi:hypothetical protein
VLSSDVNFVNFVDVVNFVNFVNVVNVVNFHVANYVPDGSKVPRGSKVESSLTYPEKRTGPAPTAHPRR